MFSMDEFDRRADERKSKAKQAREDHWKNYVNPAIEASRTDPQWSEKCFARIYSQCKAAQTGDYSQHPGCLYWLNLKG